RRAFRLSCLPWDPPSPAVVGDVELDGAAALTGRGLLPADGPERRNEDRALVRLDFEREAGTVEEFLRVFQRAVRHVRNERSGTSARDREGDERGVPAGPRALRADRPVRADDHAERAAAGNVVVEPERIER